MVLKMTEKIDGGHINNGDLGNIFILANNKNRSASIIVHWLFNILSQAKVLKSIRVFWVVFSLPSLLVSCQHG